MSEDQITEYFQRLASDGDDLAAERLWQHYYERLIQLARKRLGTRRRVSDEEDVVLSAFNAFCQGAAAGRFPRLDDRNDLWKVLVTITRQKAVDHHRRESRQKRGGGAVGGESAFGPRGIGEIPAAEPTADEAAALVEAYERRIASLDDPQLRQIAVRKLEGETLSQIAAALGCSDRTVKRRLQLIREQWEREG